MCLKIYNIIDFRIHMLNWNTKKGYHSKFKKEHLPLIIVIYFSEVKVSIIFLFLVSGLKFLIQ